VPEDERAKAGIVGEQRTIIGPSPCQHVDIRRTRRRLPNIDNVMANRPQAGDEYMINILVGEQPHRLRAPREVENLLALQSIEGVVDACAHLLLG